MARCHQAVSFSRQIQARPCSCAVCVCVCVCVHAQALERYKSVTGDSGLLAYAVSQPSLESVFLKVCGHKLDEYGEYETE